LDLEKTKQKNNKIFRKRFEYKPRIAFIPGGNLPETSSRICFVGIEFQNDDDFIR